MKLTNQAIGVMTGRRTSRIKNLIAAEMGVTESTVRRWIDENESNGELTKETPLSIIEKETGLSRDQILTENGTIN